jgi:DNA-binding response OmpR family regulator
MKRILAVDDEPHILKLIAFSLRAHGFEVLEASDGLSAVMAAEAEQPDLILLDVMMPALDGYEACRRIKANPATADIPIFMLTAKAQSAEQQTGLDAGARDYICKPFTPKDLVATVETFFAEQTDS